jgi:hypothetical protein
MNELEFSKKPRRMTSPPQNERKWLPGYEGVEVVLETEPERMAYFARECTWGDVMREPSLEELDDTLGEVAGGRVLSAAFKGGMGFRIRASRSSMDQMLRLAEGTGGAGSGAGAQTTRDNDQRNFNVIIPNTIMALQDSAWAKTVEDQFQRNLLYERVEQYIENMRGLYGDLVDAGVPPQDARYVALPLGFQTQWFHVMSLGNMIKMCEQRLCNGLTQHETNYLVRVMRDLIVERHPWMADNLRSSCEKRGQCAGSTMLFPPCGAFVELSVAADKALASLQERDMFVEWNEEVSRQNARLEISMYDPDKHLYPANMNDAMQFALWDAERQKLEKEHPDSVYSMAGPPDFLCMRIKPREPVA